ncbi:MAG: MarR family winged helix-turn-helix transcriptional regulator [Acidimicrobiales bacterium]
MGEPEADPREAVRALARASRLLERASGELSLAHYRVLAAIASGDERASRIASRLALGKPTISAAVESLCHRNLLDRSGVCGDQRVSILRLTPQGEALLARVEAGMVAQIRDLCDLSPDGEALMQSLIWMGQAIEQARSERDRAGTGS